MIELNKCNPNQIILSFDADRPDAIDWIIIYFDAERFDDQVFFYAAVDFVARVSAVEYYHNSIN